MAGHSHGQRVGSAGLRHRAHRLGPAYRPGDVGVARGPSGRDLPQALPNLLLEGRTAQIDGEPRTIDETFKRAAGLDEDRVREPVAQIALERRAALAEQDRAYAFSALGDKAEAEPGLADGVIERLALRPAALR